ncbi:hypothetical protein KSP40_PGU012621 [Platanthera guangdongensis]|uniref:Uncharacterized protein n=1 Tax=Platanthera guangdongensis TaxID=2320717 RepID=A0ABR2M8Q6_9ASPA
MGKRVHKWGAQNCFRSTMDGGSRGKGAGASEEASQAWAAKRSGGRDNEEATNPAREFLESFVMLERKRGKQIWLRSKPIRRCRHGKCRVALMGSSWIRATNERDAGCSCSGRRWCRRCGVSCGCRKMRDATVAAGSGAGGAGHYRCCRKQHGLDLAVIPMPEKCAGENFAGRLALEVGMEMCRRRRNSIEVGESIELSVQAMRYGEHVVVHLASRSDGDASFLLAPRFQRVLILSLVFSVQQAFDNTILCSCLPPFPQRIKGFQQYYLWLPHTSCSPPFLQRIELKSQCDAVREAWEERGAAEMPVWALRGVYMRSGVCG